MKIAVLGCRGIPNHYGGFEQFAEYLAVGLVERGHEVIVYNSGSHPYTESQYKGVKLVHCYDPEDKIGTAGQFVYDLNCILDARKQHFDIILQLGYTSSAIWHWLMPKGPVITTNMDGLEWKRTKYSRPVQIFLKWTERLAVRTSDHLVADSLGIQAYLETQFGVKSEYIPYGADLFANPKAEMLRTIGLQPFNYDLLVARLEPENSIEMILDGGERSDARDFIVVGNHNTKYGAYLKNRYANSKRIKFVGGIYDLTLLNNVRHFSNLYFHGHTVGGTNPSLLEAMGCEALICAHDNAFNRAILGPHGHYFENSMNVTDILKKVQRKDHLNWIEANKHKISTIYTWPRIVDLYLDHFETISNRKHNKQ